MPYVFAFIIAVAALMGWRWMQPACSGGVIVADEQQCRAAFGADFCARAMPRAHADAREKGGAFATQAQCLDVHPVCIERNDVSAWTAKPSSYCLVRGSNGEVARVEPIYSIR